MIQALPRTLIQRSYDPLVTLHNTQEEYFTRHGFAIAKDLFFTDLGPNNPIMITRRVH